MRSMSLRNRLRVSIISLVTVMVAIQFLATLRVTADAEFHDALRRTQSISTQVRSLLLDRLNQELELADPSPATTPETIALWTRFLESDSSTSRLLEKLMVSSGVVVEIQVCDRVGRILASSSPTGARLTYRSRPDFEEWNIRALWDRLYEVLTQRNEYATVAQLGLDGSQDPVFTIRVLASSVLLRNMLMPQLQSLAATSLLSLLAAILLAVLFSNMVLRALDRLGRRIDLMATGDFSGTDPAPGESAEIAAVSSKLNVLSEQFRGAMQLRGNLDHLLQSIQATVMMFDPDHRLVLVGKPAERLLGSPRDDMIGRPLDEIFPPDTALGLAIHRAVEFRRPFRDRPAFLERNGGPPRRLLVSVELLENLPGLHQLGTLITLRDVDSQRQLRSQLDVSSRLAAISRLTGGVAHEIKNPLNAIALHLEVLKAKLSAPSPVDGEMAIIEREIGRLDRVVKTFLDFARPVELSMQTVDLVALTRELAALIAPDAARHRVEVALDSAVVRAAIQADRDLLSQAVLNVVMNGIEAMNDGGRLSLQIVRNGDDFELSVSDEGTGIPPEVREKIFNLYFTTKPEGSGIGLAMTFRVVHLHDGTIEVASEVGRGTTFRLRFPASEEASANEEQAVAWTEEPAALGQRDTVPQNL